MTAIIEHLKSNGGHHYYLFMPNCNFFLLFLSPRGIRHISLHDLGSPIECKHTPWCNWRKPFTGQDRTSSANYPWYYQLQTFWATELGVSVSDVQMWQLWEISIRQLDISLLHLPLWIFLSTWVKSFRDWTTVLQCSHPLVLPFTCTRVHMQLSCEFSAYLQKYFLWRFFTSDYYCFSLILSLLRRGWQQAERVMERTAVFCFYNDPFSRTVTLTSKFPLSQISSLAGCWLKNKIV